jgi:uncharacterized integral membrane protein
MSLENMALENMARKIVNFVIVLPLALLLIVFAVANRHWVTVSFDPFNASDASVGITLPLFVVIILSVISGVLAGGAATWFKQGHWRRAARKHEADAAAARAELLANRPTAPAGRPNVLLRPPA